MAFTIVDKNTGQILYVVHAPDDEQVHYLSDSKIIYNGIVPDGYYLQNGLPIKMPVKPNDFCTFDYSLNKWIDNALQPTIATLTSTINQLTGEAILLVFPDWKQRNLTAQAVAIIYQALLRTNAFTTDEQSQLTQIFTDWQLVEQHRASSNAVNESLSAATTVDQAASIANNYTP